MRLYRGKSLDTEPAQGLLWEKKIAWLLLGASLMLILNNLGVL